MRIARIGDDGSVAQRPRTRLRRSIVYPNDAVAGGDEGHQVGNGFYSKSAGRVADDHPGQIGGTPEGARISVSNGRRPNSFRGP